MQEYTMIPTQTLNRLVRTLEKLEPFVVNQKKKAAEWVEADAAMDLLGCKKTKLWTLCKDGKIVYRTTGEGRNIRYSRKSIEQFNEQNSSK